MSGKNLKEDGRSPSTRDSVLLDFSTSSKYRTTWSGGVVFVQLAKRRLYLAAARSARTDWTWRLLLTETEAPRRAACCLNGLTHFEEGDNLSWADIAQNLARECI